ncbi:hypothetical protein MTYM_01292 [Methylococcales bacterium]|nr:hypothetical protein MTYM_01292 [Methylococcales bacterium]
MEQFYHRFFNALPVRSIETDEDLHLLSPAELKVVRSTERWALLAAALIEVVAYLVIFLPIYEFPDFFENTVVRLSGPFELVVVPFHWVKDGWMMLVTLVELYVLLLMNLAAVHGIAVATGFIRRDGSAAETAGLIRIALESRFSELSQFGIDPYERMNPWILYLYLALNRLKGLLGSVILRAVLVNVFGREMLRVWLDFSGMPIYMLINMLTTRSILRNARVVIMGETSIEIICRQLPKLALSPWESDLVYDSLQFIAVSKRDFHANHYHLTKAVIAHFNIPVKPIHTLPADYLDKLRQAKGPVADVCRLIIVLGFLLDGSLSRRERQQLARLQEEGILDLRYADLERYCREFVEGQGLDEITRRLLVS